MSPIRYETCKQDFEWDGAGRDIYVFETTVEDWNRVLTELLPYESFRDTTDTDKKLTSNWFANRESRIFREYDFHGILVDCHFFSEEEIEFSIDPRQIHDQTSLDSLITLLKLVCKASGKPTVLTPENFPTAPIFRTDPECLMVDYFAI